MTWKEVMTAAHQNLEIRPIPGIDGAGPNVASKTGNGAADPQAASNSYLAGTLSRRSYEVLGVIGNLFQATSRSADAMKAVEAPGDQVSVDDGGKPRQVAMP
jgi:penicillin-binding protein 1A